METEAPEQGEGGDLGRQVAVGIGPGGPLPVVDAEAVVLERPRAVLDHERAAEAGDDAVVVAEPSDGRCGAVGAGEGVRVDVEGAAVGRLLDRRPSGDSRGGGRRRGRRLTAMDDAWTRAGRPQATTTEQHAEAPSPGRACGVGSGHLVAVARRSPPSGPEDHLDGVRRRAGRWPSRWPPGSPRARTRASRRRSPGRRPAASTSRARSTECRSGAAGEPRCRVRVHGVVDGADQRRLLVPDRREVDLADARPRRGGARCRGGRRPAAPRSPSPATPPPRRRRGSRPSASGGACGRRPASRSAPPAPPSGRCRDR